MHKQVNATHTTTHTRVLLHTAAQSSTLNSCRFCFLNSVRPLPDPITPTLPLSGTCTAQHTNISAHQSPQPATPVTCAFVPLRHAL